MDDLNCTEELVDLPRYISAGYYSYYIPEHHLANKSGLVYEHMIVAEKILGRKLKAGEVVHHKDENKKNNSPDNIMVFKTRKDHSAYHKGCDIYLDNDVYVAIKKLIDGNKNKCPVCGKLKDSQATMCIECYNKKRSKNIPSKNELSLLLKDNNIIEISRMFNVSDTAVRKWCKKYNLPFKKDDIIKFREQN